MNAEERQLIAGLFERMRGYGAPEKDREAEALINQPVRANPDAAYMLVQSVLVQEQALQAANNRVQELEEQLRSMEGGDGRAARARAVSSAAAGAAVGGAGAAHPACPRSARAPRRRAYDGRERRPLALVAERPAAASPARAGSRRGWRLHALGAGDGGGRRRRHAGGRQHPQHDGRRRAREPAPRQQRRRWRPRTPSTWTSVTTIPAPQRRHRRGRRQRSGLRSRRRRRRARYLRRACERGQIPRRSVSR